MIETLEQIRHLVAHYWTHQAICTEAGIGLTTFKRWRMEGKV
jgi:hypothetical protein